MPIHFDEDKQNQKLADLVHKEEEDVVQLLSGKYGVEYANLTGIGINTDALRLIDEKTARELKVATYALVGKKVKLAARNPEDPRVTALAESIKAKGYVPQIVIV